MAFKWGWNADFSITCVQHGISEDFLKGFELMKTLEPSMISLRFSSHMSPANKPKWHPYKDSFISYT
jgi:hypothetical protein